MIHVVMMNKYPVKLIYKTKKIPEKDNHYNICELIRVKSRNNNITNK